MAKTHTHKYHHIGPEGRKLWACALPDCSHHTPKHYEMMLPGKKSICWNCGDEFVLDERAMKMDQPICYECTPEGKSIKDFDLEEFERIQQAKKRLEKIENEKLTNTPVVGPLIGDK